MRCRRQQRLGQQLPRRDRQVRELGTAGLGERLRDEDGRDQRPDRQQHDDETGVADRPQQHRADDEARALAGELRHRHRRPRHRTQRGWERLDPKRVAGRPRGVIRREIEGGLGDVVRPAEPTEGVLSLHCRSRRGIPQP